MLKIKLMCSTITQSVLANPSADLPAQYNTLLLHLIEAYHRSNPDAQELQMELAEETEWKQIIVDKFLGEISSWPLERDQQIQNLENANSNTQHSTDAVKEAVSATLRKHSSNIRMPKSSIDNRNSGQEPKDADKIRGRSVIVSRRRCADPRQHRRVSS